MLSSFSIYSIILFLAVQGATYITIHSSCSANQGNIDSALQEVAQMAEFAYRRTQGLETEQLSSSDLMVTLDTFRVYFGINSTDRVGQTAETLYS
jgi:hypothetical protein